MSDSGSRRFGRNARWMMLGTVSIALGQWLQLAILARVGGPAAVGSYAFALALTAPAMMLASLQLRVMQASDAADRYAFREYRVLRVSTTVLAILVIVAIGRPAGAAMDVLLPVCAMRAADALAEIYHGLWQRHEKMKIIGAALALNSTASLVLMAAGAVAFGTVSAAASGSALGSCAALAYVHLRTRSDGELRRALSGPSPITLARTRRLAWEAAPLGVIVLLGSLQSNAPRYFIRHLPDGEFALGIFAAAINLTAAGGIIMAALGSAATPRFAALSGAAENHRFRALAYRLACVGALLGAAGAVLSALIGREVLAFVYRPEFASGAGMLVILSAAAGMTWVASMLGYALTAARVIAIQPIVLSVTLGVAVVACAVLVPAYGATGAAWAVLLASAAHAIANLVVLQQFRGIRAADAPSVPLAGEAP